MDHAQLALAPRTLSFGPLTITYDERVLEPRTWTTLQSYWARELLEDVPDGPVLELCSGAGHIGLLTVHDTDRRLVCVDVDPIACGYATLNARAAGLADQVEVRNTAISTLPGHEVYPLIMADPPWVRSEQLVCFPADPVLAIDGGPDGLGLARECVRTIDRHLHPEGSALLQLGSLEQARTVRDQLPATLRATDARAEPGRGLVLLLQR